MRVKLLAVPCVLAGLMRSSDAAPVKTAGCGDELVGAWEYVPPGHPGRVNIAKLSNGHLLIVWIVTPRDGSASIGGAWEGTCEGSRRHWRILFSTDPAAVGSEVTEEIQSGGPDSVRSWLIGPDGKRTEGAARRIR